MMKDHTNPLCMYCGGQSFPLFSPSSSSSASAAAASSLSAAPTTVRGRRREARKFAWTARSLCYQQQQHQHHSKIRLPLRGKHAIAAATGRVECGLHHFLIETLRMSSSSISLQARRLRGCCCSSQQRSQQCAACTSALRWSSDGAGDAGGGGHCEEVSCVV